MSILKIGIDEAGRGPLFGRVYSAAVVLPPEETIDLTMIKDSKKFTSKKKLKQVEEYIKKMLFTGELHLKMKKQSIK